MEVIFTERDYWLAGELAKETGVSTDTLRHYERKKVLARPRRSSNGYRMYPLDAPERIRLVRRALAVGFTLDELSMILGERDKGGSPCREVHRLAIAKLKKVGEQIRALKLLREDLQRTISNWDRLLSNSTEGTQSRLLQNLPVPKNTNGMRKLSPNSKRKKEDE
ncbi:MAG: MerR family transcriptional regulator [Pyrinomonadaceae bacterium]